MRNCVTRADVAIIGAGPYGLSIAAHLRARGVRFRIFGKAMQSWRTQMPSDMLLKSEGFATNLHAPQRYPLKRFCAENDLPYKDCNYKNMGLPISRETFAAYGLEFQRQFAPNLEEKTVVALDRSPVGWQLVVDSGEAFAARKVVVAVGSSYFRHLPPALAHLPSEFLSHSSDHCDLSRFKGRDITVIGGGASACDVSASLHAAGAQVRLVARKSTLSWTAPVDEPLRGRFYPSGLGGGWRNRFFEDLPLLFRRLPEQMRLQIVRTHLGPSGGWAVRDIVERLPLLLAHTPQTAEIRDGRVRLVLAGKGASAREVLTDHIIAATGYRVDVGRLTFLGDDVRSEIRTVDNTPIMSDNFECSVPGLHFAGLVAANTFGPSMRFVLGARFAARRLARHLGQASSVR